MGPSTRERFLEHAERARGGLIAYLRGVLYNRSDLPDALQSTLLTAFAKFSGFEEGTDFRAWVLRIATLKAFEFNRKSGEAGLVDDPPAEIRIDREVAYEELLRDPDRVLESFDESVRRALLSLTGPERAALMLVAVAGCRVQEAAAILEMPVGSVMGYVGRARGKLRERLAEFARERGLARRSP